MKRFVGAATLVALALVLIACTQPAGPVGIFVPDNVFGTELPEGAVVVTEAEFLAISQDPDFRWESRRAREERLRAAEEQFAADSAELQEWLTQAPDLAPFVEGPDLSDPAIERFRNDDYLLDLPDGSQVLTMGHQANYRDLLVAWQRHQDPANQLAIYREAYELMPEEQRADLPDPDALAGADLDEILAALALLEEQLETEVALIEARNLAAVQTRYAALHPQATGVPGGYPSTPGDEEFSGMGLDRDTPCNPSSDGVYRNFSWPMKYFVTSVKDQGGRGSCVAFALTSATESVVAVRDARWVNLSEQYLYNRMKSLWDPDAYDEGASTTDMAEEFAESGYRLPFEEQWNYNASWNRLGGGDPDSAFGFVGSCIGYGERCSDTAHQGQFECVLIEGDYYCGSRPPNPDDRGFRMGAGAWVVWTRGVIPFELPVNLMRTFLAFGQPMVVSLDVTKGFRDPNADGFVVSYDDDVGGGHAVHLVGFVSNSQLAATLPGAPVGAGGGYFIIKNSWGCDWGDAGLVYVPVNWAREFFKSVTIFLGVVPGSAFVDTPPSLEITSPADGSEVLQGTANLVTFGASVDDAEGGADCCTVTWSSDVDGVMGNGATIEYGFATPGARMVTATAVDSAGGTVGDSIEIVVTNPAPVAEIIAPVPGEQLLMGIPYTLQGLASDLGNLGGVPCGQLVWTSTKSGDPTSIGCNPQITFTTLGPRILTLTATDDFGAVDTDMVSITVVEPPDLWASVTDPQPGDLYFVHDVITLKGIVSQVFDTPASYEWRAYVGGGNDHSVIGSGDVIYFHTTGSLLVPDTDWTPSAGGFTTGSVELTLFIDGANGSAESARVPITLSKLN